MLMIEPPPARCRCGIPYLVTQKTDFRLIAMTRSHQRSSVSSTERSRSFHRTPALLCRTWSAPKRRTPSSTIRCTSASTATSPVTATAWPPAFSTRATVPFAASGSMSATTIRAPSSAKSVAVSRPIPIPAPVMRATLPASRPLIARPRSGEAPRRPGSTLDRSRPLDPFEVTRELPVGHDLVERLLLQPRGVQVVVDHAVAERRARDLRALELGDRLAERLGHLRQGRVLVGVALVGPGRLQAARDAVQPGRDRRREGEIGIGVGAGDAVLHAERAALAAEPEPAGAVVPAGDDPRRRERAGLVTLVRVHARRVEVRELPRHRHLPGQPLAEERRARRLAPSARGREQRLASGLVPERGMQVERRAGRGHVVLGHERDGRAVLVGDLLRAVLVERGAVRHLERLRVAEVDLFLSPPPLALRGLDRDVRGLHAVADRADQRLLFRGLQDVVVLEVARDRREVVMALAARLVEGLLEAVELELGRGLDDVGQRRRPLDLPLENPPRRFLDRLALLGEDVAEDERRLREPRDE